MVWIVHPQAFHPFFPHAGAPAVADFAPPGKGAVVKRVIIPAQDHLPPAIQQKPQKVFVLFVREFVCVGSFTGAGAFQVWRIDEMQRFLDYFPNSERAKQAQDIIFELQDKLVYKELLNAQLYYNLGNYMGNNYQSAIITAQNALKEYPYTRYKETLSMLILKSKYQEAVQSIEEKKPERFRDVIDEYYSFINDYPSGEYSKEAENIFKVANKYVKD